MQEAVLELLLPHFTQFVQTEAPCLKLDACISAQVEIATEGPVLTTCVSLQPFGTVMLSPVPALYPCELFQLSRRT